MDPQRWELLQSLFDEYAGLPVAQRSGKLLDQHLSDTLLVEEVLAMCSAADRLAEEETPDVARLLVDLVEAPAAESQIDPYLGRTLGKYRLDELLGQGGMGRVYKVRRLDYEGVAALKVLHERIVADSISQSRQTAEELQITMKQERRERFFQEEKTLARLSHPAIARLTDADAEPDGTLYFVMEFVEATLSRRIARKIT